MLRIPVSSQGISAVFFRLFTMVYYSASKSFVAFAFDTFLDIVKLEA